MTDRRQTSESLPSYRNPPISEVAYGIKFKRIDGLMVPHFGAYWQMVRSEFPLCENAIPLADDGLTIDAITGLPIPRVWLINRDNDRLLQLQTNAFYFNWRRLHETKDYPRYKNIKSNFEKYFEAYSLFLKAENLSLPMLSTCELTYINHIPRGEGGYAAADLSAIFPDLCWRSAGTRLLPTPDQVSWRISTNLPEGRGVLSAKVEPGVRKIDSAPMWAFELSVRSAKDKEPVKTISSWFDEAHRWMVHAFSDLTDMDVQNKVWKRDDNFTC